MYTVEIPKGGWYQEPVEGIRGAALRDLGCARATVRQELDRGRRLSVTLVRVRGTVEIEDALIEEWREGMWSEGPGVSANSIQLV